MTLEAVDHPCCHIGYNLVFKLASRQSEQTYFPGIAGDSPSKWTCVVACMMNTGCLGCPVSAESNQGQHGCWLGQAQSIYLLLKGDMIVLSMQMKQQLLDKVCKCEEGEQLKGVGTVLVIPGAGCFSREAEKTDYDGLLVELLPLVCQLISLPLTSPLLALKLHRNELFTKKPHAQRAPVYLYRPVFCAVGITNPA